MTRMGMSKKDKLAFVIMIFSILAIAWAMASAVKGALGGLA